MGFFGRGEEHEKEQSEGLARIEEGGIPTRAEERLKTLATDATLFTSGLSVNEFALLGRLGPQPLAQVMTHGRPVPEQWLHRAVVRAGP